jgi:hypothetical protein
MGATLDGRVQGGDAIDTTAVTVGCDCAAARLSMRLPTTVTAVPTLRNNSLQCGPQPLPGLAAGIAIKLFSQASPLPSPQGYRLEFHGGIRAVAGKSRGLD